VDSTIHVIEDYFEANKISGKWQGFNYLPEGLSPLDTVMVIRK